MLSSSSVLVLFERNLFCSKKFSPRRRTHCNFLRNPLVYTLYSPLKADFSCGSSCLHLHRKSTNPKSWSVPCSLRSDRTMASKPEKPQSVHEFTVKDAKGSDRDLSIFKGKVLLIVNVASKCGMTNSNYTELNQLYEKYRDQGLEILAFPCNQFGEEEPGSNDQILEFVCTSFKSEFPVFDKIEVNGDNTAPLYKFLKLGKWGIIGDDIQWNFAKFLVDKNGQAVDRYYPTTSPLTIERDIQKLLGLL